MEWWRTTTTAPPFLGEIFTRNADGPDMALLGAVVSGRQARIGASCPQVQLWWFMGALVCQALDGVSGLQMMQTRGAGAELNPLARTAFVWTGPVGLLTLKAVVLCVALPLLAWVERRGRKRLARGSLLIVAGLGLLGLWSNLP